jgi:hypothetical protein
MAIDLNNPPPDDGEVLPDLNESPDDEEVLPDLNEQQAEDEANHLHIHHAHQYELVGVAITGGQIQIISPGTYLLTYLSYWSTATSHHSPALDEHHF